MSKFIDNLTAKWTGQVNTYHPEFESKVLCNKEDDCGKDFPVRKTYTLSTSWKTYISCRPQDLNPLIKNAQKQLKHHVYSDLTTKILQMEKAVYLDDKKTLLSCIQDILKEIS